MKSPAEVWQKIRQQCKAEWKTAFLAAFLLGLAVHMPVLLSDIPNHDGLDSMYFDQNMITSGRWFLTVACGFSSYYTLPWLIGLLSLFFLALTSVALTGFLELKDRGVIVLVSGLLVAFPAAASTFAYVFTMDGYMLALLLAVLALLLTKKFRQGFVPGGICLAFSLGAYQSYLPFAVLLSIYAILMLAMKEKLSLREKIQSGLHYLYMGLLGAFLYYLILQALLKMQGKVLDTYQGINGLGNVEKSGILSIVKRMYVDFASFTLKGNILFNNAFSCGAILLLALLCTAVLVKLCLSRHWWKSVWFYLILLLLALGLPVATNLILVISPDVTYHLLMRYQWVLYLILPVAFISRYGISERKKAETDFESGSCKKTTAEEAAGNESRKKTTVEEAPESGGQKESSTKGAASESGKPGRFDIWAGWGVLAAAGILFLNYAVTDNIAYSNLQKRYEKTYAYCVRLLDRIEQTPGYYQGIPVAMVGVVGDEEFPLTDITLPVTANMIGMYGDSLLYTGDNYEAFIRHFLGATLNILPADAMAQAYYSEEYRDMDSFPGADSIRIIDGILYVKTENKSRD